MSKPPRLYNALVKFLKKSTTWADIQGGKVDNHRTSTKTLPFP